MRNPPPLDAWLGDATSGEVLVDPLQINREAIANLRFFAIPRGEAAPGVEAVEAFVGAVVDARREQLEGRKSRSMTMYWWHDVLAGQLRCSLVCSSHRRLPFGARVERLARVRPILDRWLASPWLNGIPLSAFTGDPAADPEPPPRRHTIQVWATVLRGR